MKEISTQNYFKAVGETKVLARKSIRMREESPGPNQSTNANIVNLNPNSNRGPKATIQKIRVARKKSTSPESEGRGSIRPLKKTIFQRVKSPPLPSSSSTKIKPPVLKLKRKSPSPPQKPLQPTITTEQKVVGSFFVKKSALKIGN